MTVLANNLPQQSPEGPFSPSQDSGVQHSIPFTKLVLRTSCIVIRLFGSGVNIFVFGDNPLRGVGDPRTPACLETGISLVGRFSLRPRRALECHSEENN